MPAPSTQTHPAKQHHTVKRPSVKALLDAAKVTSRCRELDISFAYDVTPAVLKTLCLCMPHLRKLIVREVGLTELPDEVGYLSHLRELDVSHNGLQKLPNSLGGLHELQHLNMSRNKVVSLPDSISGMASLRLLNANYNALSALPRSFGDLTALRVLRMGANALRQLPLELGGLYDLRLVQLAYNSISEAPSVLWSLPELKVVDISYNHIERWPNDLPLPHTLSSLNVTGNAFLAQVPPSLMAAQSHDLKIIGLPKSGAHVTQIIAEPKASHAGTHGTMELNATQDITGIMFAGLGDFAEVGEPSTSPESRPHPSASTDPDTTPAHRPKAR